MSRILIVFLLFYSPLNAQLGKYNVTVTSTMSPPGPISVGQNVQFCVTVDDFNECAVAWFDGLQIEFVGFAPVSYDSDPGFFWLNSIQSTDEPPGWLGWSYDWSGNPNQTWNDYGEPGSGPWTFCFTLQATSTSQNVDVFVWSDYDTGGWGNGCGTAGDPDGPYNIWNSIVLPVILREFKAECDFIEWIVDGEINNKEFILEYSYNGEDWDIYKRLEGRGTSNSSKRYFTLNEKQGLSYWRLQQVDYDGNKEILGIEVSECESLNNECIYFNILGQEVTETYPGLKYKICTNE